MFGLGKKPQAQQVLMQKGDITADEKELLRRIYVNSSEAYALTFLPRVVFNREKAVAYLKATKEDIDKLVKVI
jgi:hypothetical protein